MNETTAKLLEQLAQKLGTTSEYLWSILLRQAPIAATVCLVQTAFVLLFGWIIFKVHKKLLKSDGDRYDRSMYDKYDIGAVLPMIIALLTFLTFLIICFCSLGDVINGYFNRDYWALEKVLDTIKN